MAFVRRADSGCRWNSTSTTASRGRLDMGTYIQANLKAVGIDTVLHNLAPGAYFTAVRTGQQNMNYWWETSTDPGLLLDECFSSRHANGGTNRNFYRNAATDQLIGQILAEANPQKRKVLIEQATAEGDRRGGHGVSGGPTVPVRV